MEASAEWMHDKQRYAITGANIGLGLESVRQLASYNDGTAELYLLCRNESSTYEAIAYLSNEYEKVSFRYIHFDSSDRSSVERAADALSSGIPDGQILNGLLLNAGGFTSDRKGNPLKSGATLIAETNLLGHAKLLDSLLNKGRIAKGSRVVFSGSEAGMGEPSAIQWGGTLQFYVDILNGSCYKKYSPADAYGHIKGMIAFYAAAFARKHPEIYIAAVSPGSTRNTSLMDQGQFSTVANFMIKGFIKLAGQHDLSVGAKRYICALTDEYEYPSGSFVCSRKGYIGEVCNATELKKGRVFGEEIKQDLVYEAVQQFVSSDIHNR
jgi:NAD(P)-dependent dehydrogenase (short-subunit alcohol dehydrogenase family)